MGLLSLDRGRHAVAVGIVTYRRPVELVRLLNALGEVSPPAEALEWIKTVVVDNSPDADAGPLIPSELAGRPVVYRHQPEPGISAARNAVIDAAYPDLVAFIDDDEVPSESWLAELGRAWSNNPTSGAVLGAVHYELPEQTPVDLLDSGVFDDRILVAGEPPEYFATGNSLIPTTLRDTFGPLFDPAFGLLGGEDGHLGERMRRAGIDVVAAPAAVVTEVVPPERLEPAWVKSRLGRKGGTMFLVEMSLARSPVEKFATVGKFGIHGVGRIALGAGLAFVDRMRGRSSWRGLRHVYLGLGHLRAIVRMPVAEYRRG